MPRSHPPTVLRVAERTLREECRLERGEKVLVAISGGSDSSALLHVLASLRSRLGFALLAHGVDHGLRPEAARELEGAARLARELDVPFESTRVDVEVGGNLQARARAARRTALLDAQRRTSATRIATAHHADDRAETVLIRLLHGGGPHALAVLPARDGPWIRPFIRARKTAILDHLARHSIAFAEDPSNRDPRFLRVRVRREVLPLLEELSPAIVLHLTALADELRQPALPAILDRTGHPVSLRRAHAREIHRAVSLGRRVQVRLSKGRELFVDPDSSAFRVEDGRARSDERKEQSGQSGQSRQSRQSGTRRKRGGAKTGKSG